MIPSARLLGLVALVAAGYATALPAQERRTFTLPETALDNLPPPSPPIDITGNDIFTIDGLFETIESIPDAFNETVHLDNIVAFDGMGVDPGVMPELFGEPMHVSVRVTGDWSFEHQGTARSLIVPFADGSDLHRINIHLPGYAYPWIFATRLPDNQQLVQYPLISQLTSALYPTPDLRNEPLTVAFGAAAQHLFRPDRFDGRLMIGTDWQDVGGDGIFDGPFTLVDHGDFFASRRLPEGPLMRLLAVVREFEDQPRAITPRPTGRVGLIEILFCPMEVHLRTPDTCGRWLSEHERALAQSLQDAQDLVAGAQERMRELEEAIEAERMRVELEVYVEAQRQVAQRQIDEHIREIELREEVRRMTEEALRQARALNERNMARVELQIAESNLRHSSSDAASERYVEAAIRYAEAVRREAIISGR